MDANVSVGAVAGVVQAGVKAGELAQAAKASAGRALKQASASPKAKARAVRLLTDAKRADAKAQVAKQASVDARVLWQVCLGWRQANGDAITVQRVQVEAPAGAFRRASRLGKAAARAPSKGARFAGVLAVIRADSLALVAA